MKRTNYITKVGTTGKYGMPVYQRVYMDDEGKRYIREKKNTGSWGYKCIENLSCARYVQRGCK